MSEIGVKLTGDNSEYRDMLSDSVEKGGEFAEHIADHVGKKLYGLRDVSHVVSNALGLNLEHIAEDAARLFSGMSKDEEEFYKKSSDLSTQAADAAIKNMRDQASEETRYQLLLKERDAALSRINQRNEESISVADAESKVREKLGHAVETMSNFELARAIQNDALVQKALAQEKERAATLSANETDRITAEKAIADLKIADTARAKADQDRFTQGEKDAADNRKQHDADQLKALEAADKVTKGIFETQSKEAEANEKLILQARARAVAESSVASEFDRQLATILKMKPGGGASAFGAPDPQLVAAREALRNAENASSDQVANPDYARNLLQAQLLVTNLESGINRGRGFDYQGAADAAFGSRQQNAAARASAEAAAAAKENARISRNIDVRLNDFFGSFGRNIPSLADSSYPTYGGSSSDVDG